MQQSRPGRCSTIITRLSSSREAFLVALLGVPGFKSFTDLLAQLYGFYGYSVSGTGIVVGAFWGLIEGFVHFGIFAWLYNLLLGRG